MAVARRWPIGLIFFRHTTLTDPPWSCSRSQFPIRQTLPVVEARVAPLRRLLAIYVFGCRLRSCIMRRYLSFTMRTWDWHLTRTIAHRVAHATIPSLQPPRLNGRGTILWGRAQAVDLESGLETVHTHQPSIRLMDHISY